MADPSMVHVSLDEAERRFLRAALLDWGGPARPSDAIAVALGFTSAERMAAETRQLWEEIEVNCTLSSTDWRRALLAAEVVFVSDVVGSGLDWRFTSGIADADALSALRGLQRKLPRWRGSWQFGFDDAGGIAPGTGRPMQ